MKDPGFIYVVRFWIAPEARAMIMDWLKGGHVRDVVSFPGFLWCRSIDLKERDEKGWHAHAMIYGVATPEAFNAYQSDGALQAVFVAQRKDFAHQLRIERFAGEVTLAEDHD